MSESILLLFALFSIVLVLVLLVVSIVAYVLHALALSRVAKAKYVGNPWLAWIPVANVWVLGSVADRIQDENGGGKIPFAKALTGLSVVVLLICLVSVVISFISSLLTSASYDLAMVSSILSMLVSIVCTIVSIPLTILTYVAYYKLFKYFSPGRAVLYIVLSIIIPGASAVCLFLCAKNADAVTANTESFDL